ncbi:HET-domain-containing protein, partial [Ophiobolus disseminans]
MRLLNAETLRFKTFFSDDQTPPYAILSHTWGDEEVSYQDMMYEEVIDNLSYQKIIETAKIAKQKHLDYFWVDTCCIDKTSSAELQEAINSMWRWYRTSAYCAVYLEDSKDSQSRWITRGWTLQELIAPRNVWFYDCNWLPTFDKLSGLDVIEEITKIPKQVLSTSDLSMSSVAQKMSWAANRKTTRIEDAAYSLMGLFDVHMPMLYGEGDNAFRRLQEQIIKTDPDDSILDW